jgi:phosphosulfolactate phosphohydrolase-like enzyme
MSKNKERRRHPRLARDERVIVQIVSSSEDTLQAGMIVRCASQDVSSQGLRIRADRPVSKGTRVELWAEISGHPSKFYLSGDVKWCSELEDEDGYNVGIELTEGKTQDLEIWKQLLEEDEHAEAKEA